MTVTEVVHHAGTGTALSGIRVRVVAEVVGEGDAGDVGDVTTLARWVPTCCEDRAVHVVVTGLRDAAGAEPAVGSWWTIEGTWMPGSGADFAGPPRLRARSASPVADPPPRLEGVDR
jgi:hypothetical protein